MLAQVRLGAPGNALVAPNQVLLASSVQEQVAPPGSTQELRQWLTEPGNVTGLLGLSLPAASATGWGPVIAWARQLDAELFVTLQPEEERLVLGAVPGTRERPHCPSVCG